jgi:nicotinamide mononucleotide adenylyltransferase
VKILNVNFLLQHNIHLVTEWIPNEVNSTRIRRALKRSESVKYLLQNPVIELIYQHGIYGANNGSM